MKYKNATYQIALSGILLAIGTIFGVYVHFGVFYFVGVIVFLFPLLLKAPFALITGMLCVFLTDTFTGYLANSWISIIAYGGALLMMILSTFLIRKWIYIFTLIFALSYLLLIYYIFDFIIYGKSFAITNSINNIIQISIVFFSVFILYIPTIKLSKLLKIHLN